MRFAIALAVVLLSLVSQVQAANRYSVASARWDVTTTWSTACGGASGSSVPAAADSAFICPGTMVEVRSNVSVTNITAQNTGVLNIGQTGNNTARILTISGTLTIDSGGIVRTNTTSNTTHTLAMTGGNIVNNGTFNMAADIDSLCNVTFSFNGSQTVSGSGGTTQFDRITLNMGATRANILDYTATALTFAVTTTSGITITNGSFRLSSAVTIAPFDNGPLLANPNYYVIPATGRFWLNNAGATVNVFLNVVTANLSLDGELRIDAGTMNLGDAADERLRIRNTAGNTARLEMNGGALNIAGRLGTVTATDNGTYVQTGGTLTVGTVGNGTTTFGPFFLGSAMTFNMSGGTIAIQRASTAATTNEYDNRAAISAVTGGTVQFGNASTPAAQVMEVASTPALPNVLINATNSPNVTAVTNLSVIGNWTNNATFTPGALTVTFSGALAQSMTGATTFNNLTMNNATGLTINSNATVSSVLTLTSGNITTGTNTVIIPAAGSVTRSSGHVAGYLQKNVAVSAGAISRTFEIGDATTYAPVNLTFASVTTSGNLTANTTTGDHPNTSTYPAASGLDVFNSVNRYWTVSNSGIVFTNYSSTFNYVAGDNDASVITSNFVLAKGDTCSGSGAGRTCAAWTLPTAGTPGPSSTQVTATGMTSFSDFAVGQRKVNNFLITVSATPVSTCSATDVSITARNASNATITNYRGTVNLTTSSSHGNWSLNTANGTLTSGTADSGAASYQFVAADNGSITLKLTNVHADNLTITTSDILTAGSSTSGNLQFVGNSFVITNDSIQVAGRNQAMTVAMNGSASCTNPLAAYTGSKNLKAWLSLDTSNPGGAAPTIGALSLPSTTPGSDNLTLNFTSGLASFNLSTTDVGKYVLNVRDDSGTFAGTTTTPIQINAGSSTITTRPFGLAIRGVDAATAIQHGTTATSPVLAKAGTNFSATVAAYLWQAADDNGSNGGTANDGVPDPGVNLTNNGLTPKFAWPVTVAPGASLPSGSGNVTGTLSNGSITQASFSGGAATVSNLQYSEVGNVMLTASASNFLNTAGVTVSGDSGMDGTGSSGGYVGRFYPDHFAISGATLTAACTVSTAFTYFGQDGFTTAFSLTAQNAANATTQNYAAAYAKLILPSYSSYGFTAATLPAGSSLASSATAPTGTWSAGVASVSARHQISRPTALTAQTTVTISAAPTDGEVPAATPSVLGSTLLRYGRLKLNNAYGSELLALPVTLTAQYWNGTAFITHADDSCTSIPVPSPGAGLTFYAEVLLGVSGNHLSAGETTATVNSPFVAGNGGLSLSRPGAGNNGYVDITVTTPIWLQYNWTGAGNANPTSRATFGIFKSPLIYRRENY